MTQLRNLYKKTVKAITVPMLEWFLRFLDTKSWAPVFYLGLPPVNTNAMGLLQVLHNIQVKTGRRVIIVSARPSWPWSPVKDRFFDSFIQGLNPKITYIFIPIKFQRFIQRTIVKLARILQLSEVLFGLMGLNSTFRLSISSSYMHADILMQGDRVVFQLPESHEQDFEAKLKGLGIAPDDWFVCVHAREHGFYQNLIRAGRDIYRAEVSDHRNVDIRTYYPAIEHIKSKGGIVIRMGDPSMRKLDDIDGVIDYPFTEHWSMLMDLYLVSKCRFVLGCNSGISAEFTQPLGVPAIITNYAEPVRSSYHPYSNFLFLLKPVISVDNERPIGLRELFQPNNYASDNAQKYEDMGYRWLPNTPEDILEATKEMMDLIESDSFDRPRTKEQEMFHQYRLDEVNFLASSPESNGETRLIFSKVSSAESRISATFAARHFANEEVQAA